MTSVPTDLRVDAGGHPLIVSGPTPRLSYLPPAGLDEPKPATLEITVDNEAPRFVELTAGQHRLTPWPLPALRSRQQVRWRVGLGAAGATAAWSEPASFEVGLLDEDWSSSWISPVDDGWDVPGERPAYALATRVDVPAGVVRARLYATALGVYEVFLRGERVGDVELAPGTSSYDSTVYAQAADVTALVEVGANDLEIVLSDGWYRGEVGAFRVPAAWGNTTAARAELHLDLADGTTRVVGTDAAWTSRRTRIVRASLMDGQTLDLTAPEGERHPVRVDIVSAPPVQWSPAPPVRVVETRKPVSVTEVRPGVWVADFGQNASGRIRLIGLGPAGTRTVIDHGEYIGADGDLSTAHLDSSGAGSEPTVFVQRDIVVSDGRTDVFEPRHTVHGFQYARITRSGAPLDPTGLSMRILHSDLRPVGAFSASDGDLDRLHALAEWSFRGNAVDVPTDCPTRERLAWSGDYQVFAPTATRMFDVLGFTRKWLRAVRDDQLEDGRIANFSPDGKRIKTHLDDRLAQMTGSAGWGDAIVAVPWEMYRSYGDVEILSENWDAMRRWVDWALSNARTARHHSRQQRSAEPAPHEQYLWDGSFHWGEWCEPKELDEAGNPIDPVQQNPMAWFMADKGEVGTAYLHRSAKTLATIAGVLGHDDAAAQYADVAGRVKEAWVTEYLREGGRTAGDTQASYVRALAFDLIPAETRAGAVARLVELIEQAGNHLGTGFLATGDLLPVLADNGHADLAYRLLQQRTSPSWMVMLDRGATTIWEEWDGIDEQGRAHASLNHYSKGVVARFLHSHVAGLRQAPGSIGWDAFEVAPVPGGGLTWAETHHDSPQGRIETSWQRDGDDLVITVTTPPGSRATVVFPSGKRTQVTAGTIELRGR